MPDPAPPWPRRRVRGDGPDDGHGRFVASEQHCSDPNSGDISSVGQRRPAEAVIVLDEPVSALDPEGRRDVLELIASLRGETTVLFSTHVLADVERICDRVGILDHGRLVVEGSLAELLDRFALPVYRVEAEPGQAAALESLAARLRAADWVTGAAVEHGLLTVAVADPDRAAHEILPAITAEGVSVISVARARPTLEDVFLRLTGGEREAAA